MTTGESCVPPPVVLRGTGALAPPAPIAFEAGARALSVWPLEPQECALCDEGSSLALPFALDDVEERPVSVLPDPVKVGGCRSQVRLIEHSKSTGVTYG